MDPLVVLDEKYIPQQNGEQADTGRISKRWKDQPMRTELSVSFLFI